ncbi:hypothetical protein SAMN05216241_102446 [Limimonas halophila]|uniref:Uncharacterized protein n=1 Tax=Limimonas halophila TaxID=1082479 RepID=A0A1G7P5V8_9PROT|nr:hypothetical protein SAMN05216241_102446 [Limimonas halophila]
MVADGSDNSIRIAQHVVVPEPHDGKAAVLQIPCPSGVLFVSQRVLAAIDFHDQPMGHAYEIDHIGADRVLTAKLYAHDPAPTQS